MLLWIQSNLGTIIISMILLVLVGLAVRSLVREKKSGRSSCGCGCANCAMAGKCHPSPNAK